MGAAGQVQGRPVEGVAAGLQRQGEVLPGGLLPPEILTDQLKVRGESLSA